MLKVNCYLLDTMSSFIEKKESLTIEPAPVPSKKKIKFSASNYLKQNPNPSNPKQLEKKDASTCTADLGIEFLYLKFFQCCYKLLFF